MTALTAVWSIVKDAGVFYGFYSQGGVTTRRTAAIPIPWRSLYRGNCEILVRYAKYIMAFGIATR
jgi:hypothetical protein